MIHYIYRIDFLCGKPGRYYLGKHSFRYKNLENSKYAGSGNFCKKYYAKYGKIKNKTYKITVIETNPDFETNRLREKDIIGDLWKTDPLCMNQGPGGGIICPKTKRVYQYTLKGELIAIYDTIVSAMDATGASAITGCCKGKSYAATAGGYVWRYEGDAFDKYFVPKRLRQHKNKQKINQYGIDGTFIKTWDCVEDISITLANTKSTANIRKCITHTGGISTCYGYRWKIYNGSTENLEPLKVKTIRPVNQYDLDGNFISKYRSCQSAAIAIGKKHVEGIMRCAKGLQKSSYGYKWKFVET